MMKRFSYVRAVMNLHDATSLSLSVAKTAFPIFVPDRQNMLVSGISGRKN